MASRPEPATGTANRRRKRLWLASLALLAACAGSAIAAHYWSRWDHPANRFAAARQALKSGDLARVRKEIARLEDVPAYAPHRHYLQGALLLQQGEPADALRELEQALGNPALEIETLVLSGQALYQSGERLKAHTLWQRAVSLNPSCIDAYRWLGVYYYDSGAMELAVRYLSSVSKLDPKDSRSLRLMGLIYKDYEQYRPAVDCYRESLRRDGQPPDRASILLELAACEIALPDCQAALATLAQCADSPEKSGLQARAYYELGEQSQAEHFLAEALKLSPRDFAALLLRGKMRLGDRDAQGAIEALKQAAEINPQDDSVHLHLAQAYQWLGDAAQAAQHEQRSVALRALWSKVYDLHTKANQEPANADARYQLGMALRELGRDEMAEVWFRAALSIDPSHAEAIRALQPDK
jgi:tetratricopeptide (TPR) repeat protein